VLPVIGELPLATAAVFDLGVYLTVVGATLLALMSPALLRTVESERVNEDKLRGIIEDLRHGRHQGT
jgi:hypothetical protein